VIEMINRLSLSQAGRLAEFDNLAHQFFVASADARDALYQQATALAASAGVASKHYLRVMEKLVNGTEGYVEKETKRYATINHTYLYLR
jgi:protein disulfide-isomerase A6